MRVAVLLLLATVAGAATQPVARITTGRAPCGAAAGYGSVWVSVYETGQVVRIDPRHVRDHEIRRLDAVGRHEVMCGERRLELPPDEEVHPRQQDGRHGGPRVALC